MLNEIFVKLKIYSNLMHTSQIITGFRDLESLGKIKLEIIDFRIIDCHVPHDGWIEAEVNGINIAYDVLDGYNFEIEKVKKYIIEHNINFLFKRSFSSKENKNLPDEIKNIIYPLGFNYYVTCKNNPLDDKNNILSVIKQLITGKIYSKNIECVNNKINHKPYIIFATRLWDTNEKGIDESLIEERKIINKTRIGIIKILKNKYPKYFFGGVYDDKFSRIECPELIIPKKYTKKKKYLNSVKKSNICIGSMGLHKSIGWKTAEYIVAGKAIINEKLYYEVPGNFKKDSNYFEFNTIEECIEKVDYLFNNITEIKKMSQKNKEYYNNYLKPSILIENTLKIVL